jgi:hypothetical protein
MASVLQALWALPELQQRYVLPAQRIFASAPGDPAADFATQFAKACLGGGAAGLAAGLAAGSCGAAHREAGSRESAGLGTLDHPPSLHSRQQQPLFSAEAPPQSSNTPPGPPHPTPPRGLPSRRWEWRW